MTDIATTKDEYSKAVHLRSITDALGNDSHFTYDDFVNVLTEEENEEENRVTPAL